ncbi:MAG TPA: tetratricopeptide repeat protein [Candidatus Baltobacteraceae bacterium]
MFAVRGLLTGLFGSRRRHQPSNDDYGRGLAALERGDLEAACRAFEAALAAAGTARARAQAFNKRGVAHARAGRHPQARTDFEAALESEPRFAPALVNVGNLFLEEGRLPEAIASYEAATRSDDRYAPAYANLGVAYRRLGRYGDAVRALRRATVLEISRGSPGRA